MIDTFSKSHFIIVNQWAFQTFGEFVGSWKFAISVLVACRTVIIHNSAKAASHEPAADNSP